MKDIKEGRIVNIMSNQFYVEIDNNVIQCTSRGVFKNKEIKPIVGDIVKINEKEGTIIQVCHRNSYIKRPKIANITQLIFVISTKRPKPDLLMLDKQLAFAEFLGIPPIIIINKIDLDVQIANEIEKIYSKIGYKVIKTNAKDLSVNIKEIETILKNNINVFSGNSGVGKSTMINSIFNKTVTKEGEISQKNEKGKNTTTWVKLYKIEDNTYVADTPGFSTFDIEEIEYKQLYKYFKEFNTYINKCEYDDCTHIKEKNCGIKSEIGKNIAESRYINFKRIYEELKDKELHKW